MYTESLGAFRCCTLIYPGVNQSYELAQTDGADGSLKAGSHGFWLILFPTSVNFVMGKPSESPSSYSWETPIQAHLTFSPNTQHGCDAGPGPRKPSISAPSCPSLSLSSEAWEGSGSQSGCLPTVSIFFLLFKKEFNLFIYLAVPGCICRILRDLVPELGMEPRPPALGGRSLSHWTAREVPGCLYFLAASSPKLQMQRIYHGGAFSIPSLFLPRPGRASANSLGKGI